MEFRFIDFMDLVIVAIIIAGIYYALKNTIAIKILFGLVILIVLSFFTEAMDMKALNWIIKTVLNIWLIGFIVLFQPELRKALVMLTKSPIFSIFVKAKSNETLEVLVETVKEFSRERVGALLVFPKNQNVQMTMETGVPLHANVSRELLFSIFKNQSALHDGAVIIENQTVIAARCILPLSNMSQYKGRNLGTRHKAALGLSEQSDAVVLIVSEETGWISIANKGELNLNIPLHILQNELSNALLNN